MCSPKPKLLSMGLIALCITAPSQASRPKGVRAELASFYDPAADFKCLDGSNLIPFIQVNDDYCDCEDGSDEPGTSACPNGKFFCENAGHKALVIPSSRVGDTVCDCCDGSDESDSKKVTCENTCDEAGRAAREASVAANRVAIEGFKKRKGMVNEAKVLLDEQMVKVQELEAKKAGLEASKEGKQKYKEETEAPEKEALDYYKRIEEEEKKKQEEEEAASAAAEAVKYFSILDTDLDGVVTMTELQARPGLDTNKDGEVSEEEAKFFLGDKETFDIESFKDSGFALLKPYLELEQAAPVLSEDAEELELTPPVEEYHVPDHPMMTPPPTDFDPDAPDHPMMTPSPDDVEDYTEETDEDEEEDYDINDHEEDEDEALKPEEVKEEASKYDEKTQELISNAEAARKAYTDVDRELRDAEREIKQLKESLEKDHGEDNVYAVLSGQCFSHTDNEYTYKMCPFDHSSQRGKNGGSETRLGGWGEWTGPEGDKYASMKFTGGQGCWNGPARSSIVHLHCGADNMLSGVTEPNRCEYEMHFSTPAACKLPPGVSHDEL